MAQVTMTGNEYAELLHKEQQLTELLSMMRRERKVRIPEGAVHTYSVGEFPEVSEYPTWLKQHLVDDMVTWLRNLPEDEFIRWACTDNRYYDVMGRCLQSYGSGNHIVDLWERPGLRDLVKRVREEHLNREEDENRE